MDETPKGPGRSVVVQAPAEIDYATAPALITQLAEALAVGAEVVVDCSQVTFCDSTALKVLINSSRHARALDVDFRIADPPRGMLRIAAILQASDLLGLPPPASARP